MTWQGPDATAPRLTEAMKSSPARIVNRIRSQKQSGLARLWEETQQLMAIAADIIERQASEIERLERKIATLERYKSTISQALKASGITSGINSP